LATKIRLHRIGAKKRPFYKIVVTDSRMPRDGRFKEIIGYYQPTKEPVIVHVEEAKAIQWMLTGAKPSSTARALFKSKGIMAKFAYMKQKGLSDPSEVTLDQIPPEQRPNMEKGISRRKEKKAAAVSEEVKAEEVVEAAPESASAEVEAVQEEAVEAPVEATENEGAGTSESDEEKSE
jgi:small subunit ribosomal protein S16